MATLHTHMHISHFTQSLKNYATRFDQISHIVSWTDFLIFYTFIFSKIWQHCTKNGLQKHKFDYPCLKNYAIRNYWTNFDALLHKDNI